MKYKAVIFDLDMTLVNSSSIEHLRKKREWKTIYDLIENGRCSLYEDIYMVLQQIKKNNIKICIVSNSPSTYVNCLIKYFNLPCDYIIGYHDAKPIKPHPAPMLKALELLNEDSANVISFGDRAIDIQSSNSANIKSVACFWGTEERELLQQANYTKAIERPSEILVQLKK